MLRPSGAVCAEFVAACCSGVFSVIIDSWAVKLAMGVAESWRAVIVVFGFRTACLSFAGCCSFDHPRHASLFLQRIYWLHIVFSLPPRCGVMAPCN